MKIKHILTAAAIPALLAGLANAETIGYSSNNFDDNFQTILRTTAEEYAKELGHDMQVEDAREDVGTQMSQIQNLIAAGVSAIIVTPVSTEATPAITEMVTAAGIPLVYINRRPADVDALGGKSTYVGSDNAVAGKLQGEAACAAVGGTGTAVELVGFLRNEDAQARTNAVDAVLATDACKGLTIVDKQEGEWQRTKGADLVTNWLSSGVKPDVIFANNDEMALGAIQALKSAGIAMEDVVVAGIDGTPDAFAAMEAGDLDITVYQDAKGQAKGAVDAALAIIGGADLPGYTDIPFIAITPENLDQYK